MDIRIIAGSIVMESKLSKCAKLQLLNFLQKEASIAQVKAFILDGEIVSLDEQSEEIVNDRFAVAEAGGRVAQLRKTAFSVGTIGPIWPLYRIVRSAFDQCTNTCGKFELNTARRQFCMAQCKVKRIQGELAAANKTKNQKEIAKKTKELTKAKAVFDRYKQTFSNKNSPY